ncbi:OmpA family protein [Streptomyces sodiiphilus]|uniref:OmpA family protein n=1 Tax=Streptomyces sodiiphilus TaxID=226217 RepID=UPI0031D966A5
MIAAACGALVGMTTSALADDGEEFEQPPGYEAPPVPEIDANSPGLKLGDGATLAEPRVLDIKFVTEDLGSATPAPETGTGEDSSGDGGNPGGGGGGPESIGGEQREERTGGQRKFTLQTDVIFGKDSDEVSPETREALKEVAAAIDESRPERVNVFGFTDNLGSYEHGIGLSNNRAKNTHEVLVELLNDPSGIEFNVRGYSEDYPLYDNATEEGRQKNRRVEISWPSGN